MGRFKLICAQCGSENVLEKSGQKDLDWVGDRKKLGEGMERRCQECSNESFEIIRTWLQ